jgi:hypothetical protein
MRRCPRCDEVLPGDRFGKHRWCKSCLSEYHRERRGAVSGRSAAVSGPRKLLTVLVDRGLDREALVPAAALVQSLDMLCEEERERCHQSAA